MFELRSFLWGLENGTAFGAASAVNEAEPLVKAVSQDSERLGTV